MNGATGDQRYARNMTGSHYGMPPGGPWAPPVASSTGRSRPPKYLLIVTLVSSLIAVAAIGLAATAWFRSGDDSNTEDTPARFSEQEITAAKESLCAAYQKTSNALTKSASQFSEDPNVKYMLSLNTRLTIHANASYLRTAVANNPALDSGAAKIFDEMSSAYDDILMAQLADAPAESFEEVNAKLDDADARAADLCG